MLEQENADRCNSKQVKANVKKKRYRKNKTE